MSNESGANLAWLDLETTGLDPASMILEIGVAITTPDLDIVDTQSVVIGHNSVAFRDHIANEVDGYVRKMHTNNGLWDEVAASQWTLPEATWHIAEFIRNNDAVGNPMGGSGVHFDRQVLSRWSPPLLDLWHYRNLDVSVTRTQVDMWAPHLKYEAPTRSSHRSLDDVNRSIAEARWYRDHVFARAAQTVSPA